MIKNQLHSLQKNIRNGQDKYFQTFKLDNVKTVKNFDQTIAKGNKFFQQILDILLIIGTLQLLRKHIAYQLNTTCKFDSAHLEASLRNFNE